MYSDAVRRRLTKYYEVIGKNCTKVGQSSDDRFIMKDYLTSNGTRRQSKIKQLLALTLATLVLLITNNAHAGEFIVTSVIRDFPMRNGEIMYKDFYINAGSNNGLKNGAFLDTQRKQPAFDNINSKLLGDTNIKIARLKLIHVDKNFSIARLVKFYDKDSTPLTGIDSVMIGDTIFVSEKQ